jgi:heme/copper-type cytochrome/quinol oxidase subunit 2
LEITWTLIPGVIMALIVFFSTGVWNQYRYFEPDPKRPPAEILVVGQQFAWNVVYPGPDGKLGRYLVFPRPTDPKYRHLTEAKAVEAISTYIDSENPLGRDENWTDPAATAGQDDDYALTPGRAIIVPADWPITIHLSSKDVIHDFFLPNFRVKLDAVPGMHGIINFEAKPESQSTEERGLDDADLLGKKAWIDQETPHAQYDSGGKNYFVADPADASRKVHSLDILSADGLATLKAAGLQKVSAVMKPYEVVCEQLCGDQHYTMHNDFFVVSKHEYDNFMNKVPPAAAGAGSGPVMLAHSTTPVH